MNHLNKDMLFYAQSTLSIFILLQSWANFELTQEIKLQYETIEKESGYVDQASSFIQERMWLYESFSPSTEYRNELAEPFLEYIQLIDKDDIDQFESKIGTSIENFSQGYRDEKFDRQSKVIFALLQKYPDLFSYAKSYFYNSALMRVGTTYHNCCFCGPRYRPVVEEQEGEYRIFPTHFQVFFSFNKLKINAVESNNLNYNWTPSQSGPQVIDLEYVFINDNDAVETLCEQFVLYAE